MWSIAVSAATVSFSGCFALQQQSLQSEIGSLDAEGGPVFVALENEADMSFTAKVAVSGQEMHPIMDTGSFELVLFEHGCTGCEADTTFFDTSKADASFTSLGVESEQGYGSGTAVSGAKKGKVGLGPMHTPQMFWLAHDLMMDVAVDDSFGGIFGLGPPASAQVFAKSELEAATQEISALDKKEQGKYQDTLRSLHKVVELAKLNKPWLQNIGCTMFSICLMHGQGQNGLLILRDQIPESKRWIHVNGDYWQIQVPKVTTGDLSVSSCNAIVDSGTSLIGVPSAFLDKIEMLVAKFSDSHGCEDLSQWPKFNIHLHGGQVLSLDPSSYVAQFEDNWDSFAEQAGHSQSVKATIHKVHSLMPHLVRFRARIPEGLSHRASSFCAPAVFAMDMGLGGQDGCQFLLGLPVFRQYYVSHKFGGEGHPVGMMFSKSDGGCKHMNVTDMTATNSVVKPFKVDPRKIRFPTRSHAKPGARWAFRVGHA